MSERSAGDRPRKPIKGVRLRFRTAVRKLGVTGRFSTDFSRKSSVQLLVFCREIATKTIIQASFNEFEGYPVVVMLKPMANRELVR